MLVIGVIIFIELIFIVVIVILISNLFSNGLMVIRSVKGNVFKIFINVVYINGILIIMFIFFLVSLFYIWIGWLCFCSFCFDFIKNFFNIIVIK